MLFGKKKRRIERILVVEDEPLVAFDTEHFLTEEGYTIVGTVGTVGDAVAALDGIPDIHLILVDISLPDGSGIDVARSASARGIAVVFVTGQLPMEDIGFAAGFLSKPYPQRDLLHAIEAVDAMKAGAAPKRVPPSFTLFRNAA